MLQLAQPTSHPTQNVPMLVRELETANTLLDLHGAYSTETSTVPIEPENTATTIELPHDLDAMDKIVGYCEEPNLLRNYDALKSNDAMDLIVSTQPDNTQLTVLNVETVTTVAEKQDVELDVETMKLNVLNVEMVTTVAGKQDVGLKVETTKVKACHVCVRPLESIVFED